MTPSRRPVGAPALVPAFTASVPALPAPAAPTANRFDGAWSVVATAETGSCTGPYRYPIVIRNGIVDEAGNHGVDASGQAMADGRITGTIRSGLASVALTGTLRGCAGSWAVRGKFGAGCLPCHAGGDAGVVRLSRHEHPGRTCTPAMPASPGCWKASIASRPPKASRATAPTPTTSASPPVITRWC